jgi:hypothetical protein
MGWERAGGVVMSLCAAAWALLVKGDEVKGAMDFAGWVGPGLFALLREWGWVVLLALGLAAWRWGHVRPLFSYRMPTRGYMSLDDAVDYVVSHSEWVIRQDPETWIEEAMTDIRDQLALGSIRAIGRRARERRGDRINALEPIPAEAWRTARFAVTVGVFRPDGQSDVQTNDRSWTDVRVVRKQVMRLWRPLRPWERAKHKPPYEDWDDDRRDNSVMIELTDLELARPNTAA